MKNLVLFLLIYSKFMYSQERINEVRPSLSKQFYTLSKIDGWEFNEHDGKWLKKPNLAGLFDCISLEFRKIIVEDEKFYVLTIKEKEGSYKYPSIKKGWIEWTLYRSYIFNEYEFIKLKTYNSIYSKYYQTNSLNDYYDKFDLSSLSNDCYQSIIKGEKEDLNFYFNIKNIDNKKVRFILPFAKGNEFLEVNYGFDKCYFEVEISEFNKLINDTNLQK